MPYDNTSQLQSAVEKVKVASSILASGHDRARQSTIGQSLAVGGLKIMTDRLEQLLRLASMHT